MNSEKQDNLEPQDPHELPPGEVTDITSEYAAYREIAEKAYVDSVRAYENMDKWMLTLSGGAFALSATLASNSSSVSLMFYAGILLFAFSTSVLLHSKYASYIALSSATNEIENIYKKSPNHFVNEYYLSTVDDTKIFNKKSSTKNRIGLWTFIVGIALISISLVPPDIF